MRTSILTACLCVLLSACAEIQRPEPEPFYAETTPPAKQEFRWSNGKAVKSFDPARAAAAPETDIVRALFEGLTDIDAKTLKEVPAVAEKWTSSADLRECRWAQVDIAGGAFRALIHNSNGDRSIRARQLDISATDR